MTNAVNKLSFPFLLLIIFIILDSCSIEKKFAKEFISNDSTRMVMVISPDFIYKNTLTQHDLVYYSELDYMELDSVSYEESLFLQYIWDTVFIDDYYISYCDALRDLGYTVFGQDSIITFLSGKPDAHILNIAQLELEEYFFPVIEREEVNGKMRYGTYSLNAVNINSWIEISSLNEEENNELVFSSMFLTEEVTGVFRINYFKNKVRYICDKDSLFLDEVYQLGALAGYLYAGSTFDYFMNQHIDKRMKERNKYRSDTYYHYHRRGRYVAEARYDEMFTPLEEE